MGTAIDVCNSAGIHFKIMYRGVTCMAETPCRCHSYERVTMQAIPAFNPWRAWG